MSGLVSYYSLHIVFVCIDHVELEDEDDDVDADGNSEDRQYLDFEDAGEGEAQVRVEVGVRVRVPAKVGVKVRARTMMRAMLTVRSMMATRMGLLIASTWMTMTVMRMTTIIIHDNDKNCASVVYDDELEIRCEQSIHW